MRYATRWRAWLSLATIVGLLAIWFALPAARGRHQGWTVCRELYAAARTARDTSAVDAHTPLVVGLLVAPSPACGELRRRRARSN